MWMPRLRRKLRTASKMNGESSQRINTVVVVVSTGAPQHSSRLATARSQPAGKISARSSSGPPRPRNRLAVRTTAPQPSTDRSAANAETAPNNASATRSSPLCSFFGELFRNQVTTRPLRRAVRRCAREVCVFSVGGMAIPEVRRGPCGPITGPRRSAQNMRQPPGGRKGDGRGGGALPLG